MRNQARGNRPDWRLFASIGLTVAIAAILFCLFGDPFGRWGRSFAFLGDAWAVILRIREAGETKITPPNDGTAWFEGIKAAFGNFLFLTQQAAGLLINAHWAKEFGSRALILILRLVQALQWLPFPVIAAILAKMWFKSSKPRGLECRKTKALMWWEERKGVLKPRIEAGALAFRSYLRNGKLGKWFPVVWVFLSVAISPTGCAIADFFTSYFYLMLTMETSLFLPTLVSIAADAAETVSDSGAIARLALAGYITYLILRNSALKSMREMQGLNFLAVCVKAVGIFFKGAPGVGKTTACTSMAIDYSYRLRDQLLGDIHEARGAFPAFPWGSLETWIVGNSGWRDSRLPAVIDPEGRLIERVAPRPLISTRAQLELAITSFYRNWKKAGFPAEDRLTGKRYFWGYDGTKERVTYFDGAKDWEILDAVNSYAEAYFLLFPGLSLMTAGYSILDRSGADVSSFTLYGKHDDYLKKGCSRPGKALGYCQVLEWDGLRLGKKVDEGLARKQAGHFDGGALVLDELSLERGNRLQHYGKGSKDGETTPANDDFNNYGKLFRHFLTNNNKPIGMLFGNTQRENAVGSDLMNLFEETLLIDGNGGEDNALPFWGPVSAAFGWVCDRIDGALDLMRNKELPESLASHALAALRKPFSDYLTRMRNTYGFERLHIVGWTGKDEQGTGGEKIDFEYYNIYRKMRAYTFKTDAFHALAVQKGLAAGEGFLKAPHYQGLDPSASDYENEGSYIVQGILGFLGGSKDDANENVKRISEVATNGN